MRNIKRVRNKEQKELLICGIGILLTIITTIIVLIVGSNRGKDRVKTISSVAFESSKTQDPRTQEEILLINIDKNDEKEVLDAPEKAEEIEKEKSTNTNTSKTGYYIKINNTANVVTVYSLGEDGNMTPIKAMTCSTGTATPSSGVYSVKGKRTWGYLFGDVWGHYTTNIVGNILFHSVPYLSNSPDTLEYWEYDKLGTSASMGCVRLTVADAKWIFDNMPYGTPVEFYEDSNPGPLGKPATMKISGNTNCRDWDPTDPDSDNPWRDNQEETRTTESSNTNSENNSNNMNNVIENKSVETKQNETTQTQNNQAQSSQTQSNQNENNETGNSKQNGQTQNNQQQNEQAHDDENEQGDDGDANTEQEELSQDEENIDNNENKEENKNE